MRRIVKIVFAFGCCFMQIKAQVNFVSNPSFEDTISCPNGQGELYKATGWSTYKYSPDYMNTCSVSGSGVSVPNNLAGYQMPASGNAYAACAAYSSKTIGSNYREFFGSALSSSLTIGTKYYVCFKICLAFDSITGPNCASNKMGVNFSTLPYTISNPAPISNTAKVYANMIVSDTLNWTRIFGSFIADSSYSYIIIGNFFDDMNTDTLIINTSQLCYYSYYYIDDVCVSTDSSFAYNYSYTSIEENSFANQVVLYPNPVKDILNVKNQSGSPLNIEVSNAFGDIILRYQTITATDLQINVSNIDSGIFFVKVRSSKQVNIYKLLKLES